MYGVELMIITVGTFGCALASPSPTISAAGLMIFWRVLMVWKPPLFFQFDQTSLTQLPGHRYWGRLPPFFSHYL